MLNLNEFNDVDAQIYSLPYESISGVDLNKIAFSEKDIKN